MRTENQPSTIPMTIARPSMIRVSRAMDLMGISRATLYRRVNKGIFTIIKRGECSYVSMAEIEAYLDPNAEIKVG